MRLRKLKNSEELIFNSKYIVSNPKDYIGKWNKVFNNDNPIHIEIGMGKGKFILEKKKIDEHNISNLKLIRIDAEELNQVFDKEIDIIYLNFSDPWPKDRHEKRRLTNEKFLKVYDNLFKKEKIIIQKTDNRHLFEYSLFSLVKYGYKIDFVSLDLHKDYEDITTEYEEKFMKLGPIYKAVYKK